MKYFKYIACLFGMALLVACGQKHHNEGHSHDDITIPYTGYSNSIEVFADVEPLAVGANSQMIIHFTDLSSFKPVVASEVEVALIVGQKGLKVKSDQAVQDGIFKVVIQPQTAGVGYLEFILTVQGKKHKVSVTNVNVYKNQHDAVHLTEANLPVSANGISFTKEQAWKVDFMTQMPDMMEFGNVIKSGAKVDFSPTGQFIVSAKTNGFVKLSSGIISAGQAVKPGEWLMTVTGEGLTDNNALIRLQEAKVEYDIAMADYERDKRLNSQKIVSDKQFLESKARFDKARTHWTNLQNTVGLSGEKVVAESEGFVNQLLVENGQYVEAGTALFTMVQAKKMLLKAMLRPRHLPMLNSLYDANIELNNGTIVSLADLNGRIVSVGQAVSENAYLLPVSIEVDHNQRLTVGGFTNVYLRTVSSKKEIVIPKTALIETQGMYFVYVQLTPELFERRQVKLGATDGDSYVITQGLNNNERFVARGATFVKLAAVSSSVDPHAGHVH
ncbi:efflux RND transporter periplasmic adaptor subunit [Carboxylicivirga sp. RSCT41]|uniref:efflux RND transporter periplasmic adaptor subunit n=1 Tax=Carboxylicivirga agarovorans TaxID=3417570 RepID=UPI003D33DA27